MMTHVNSVLIGKTIPTAFTNNDALKDGEVALFDQDRKVIANAAAAKEAKQVYIGAVYGTNKITMPDGSVADKPNIKYSMPIQKNAVSSMVVDNYVPSAEDVLEFDLTNVTPAVGERYVLRIIYTDIHEAPGGSLTKTYDFVAKTTDVKEIVSAFKEKVNKTIGARVVATINSETKLVLTAKPKDDNEGKESINEYSQVAMEGRMWKTNPNSGIISNDQQAVPGLVITKTQGTPGKGNAKIIRDREKASLGYEGVQFITHWPVIKPALRVDLEANYDTLVIENDNKYLSDDNQYIKTTPIATELYVEEAANLPESSIVTMLNAFIKGEVAA